jgi:CPA1 family monovalent cation:H+ antiporter
MMEHITIQIAAIAGLGFACQWASWFLKLPAILLLLICGMILGPATGWLQPDLLLGELLFPMVSLCVALILFEGSLTLNYQEIKSVGRVVQLLTSLGVVISWAMLSLATHFLFSISWAISWLIGAIIVVSGPTVIVPMLRSVRPNSKISNILRWEGIIIDPIGAMLAVLVYEYLISSLNGGAIEHTLVVFARITTIGCMLGLASGWLLARVLRERLLPAYLQSFAAVTLVLISFTLANHIEHESGLLCVTVMGIYLANQRDVNMGEILSFKEHLSVLLISTLFILLAARITPSDIIELGPAVLMLLLTLQFIIRPAAVFISSINSQLSWQEKVMIAWIAPRGIVAAAVSALFAIRLENSNYPEAQVIVPLTFAVIIGTVLFQSATARVLAKWLKVAEPSPRGVLFAGANPVARSMALALNKAGFDVTLTDTSWEHIRNARMEGLTTFYGNPNSEFADGHLNLVGIGRLIAASPMRELNALTCMRYRLEFGHDNVYSLYTSNEAKNTEKHGISQQHKGQTVASEDLTYAKFASLLKQDSKIKTTTLSEAFDFEQLTSSQAVIPLFAIDKKEHLHIFTPEKNLNPKAGWQVISLTSTPPAPSKETAKETTKELTKEA